MGILEEASTFAEDTQRDLNRPGMSCYATGHSLGGLSAMAMVIQYEDLFVRYLILVLLRGDYMQLCTYASKLAVPGHCFHEHGWQSVIGHEIHALPRFSMPPAARWRKRAPHIQMAIYVSSSCILPGR